MVNRPVLYRAFRFHAQSTQEVGDGQKCSWSLECECIVYLSTHSTLYSMPRSPIQTPSYHYHQSTPVIFCTYYLIGFNHQGVEPPTFWFVDDLLTGFRQWCCLSRAFKRHDTWHQPAHCHFNRQLPTLFSDKYKWTLHGLNFGELTVLKEEVIAKLQKGHAL